jgi:hypothetical protein
MFDQPFAQVTDAGCIRSLPRSLGLAQEMLRMIRNRLAAALLAAAAFAAAAAPASAVPGNGAGKSTAQDAQDDHKPAGTGSGRKIG